MASKFIINLSIILPVLHAGILLGVSFLATPIKFSIPSLPLPVALDIGKATFHALIKLEWFLVGSYFTILWVNHLSKLSYIFVFIIFVALITQTFWVLPTLDTRVTLIQQGISLETSYHHFIYITLDIVKIISLIWISYSILIPVHNND